ncbi:MAG: FAD-binding oxidoreductase [Chloroflexi bacterium]|nr:FAD-binding oxidoreductase [Chloroflexota bacterium]
MTTTADVVIIGGGITGTSAAFCLAQRGVKVALVEKRFIAAGATGKSTAIIRQHYSNEITAKMALASVRVFQNFNAQVGGECGYVKTGFVILVNARDRQGLEENVAMQKRVGIDVRIVNAAELLELDPGMRVTNDILGAYEPDGGYADPAFAAANLANAAKKLGAEILQSTVVTGIAMNGGRVAGVQTNAGKISAPAVVNCANAWAPAIAKMVGVDLPIEASRHQVATFQRPPDHKSPHLAAGDFVHNIYFRPEAGLTFVGSIDPDDAKNIADPDQYNESADFEFIAQMSARICERYPFMKQALSKGGWTGIYDVTPDWHPIIDEAPRGSGVFHAAGFSGHGFKLGPAVGVMIADMVTGVSAPTGGLDRHLFRLARFAENDPVRGKYEYSIVG